MLSAIVLLLILFVPDWIEALFRVDPDQHTGSLEWAIVAVSLVAVMSAMFARLEWRRAALGST